MSIYGFRFRVGVSLVLGLIWTSAALGDRPLFPGAQYAAGGAPRARGQCEPQWLPGAAFPGLDADAHAAVVYDDGSGPALYVGGGFGAAGDVVANGIVRWDGSAWSPLGSGMNGGVGALTVYNGELIAGGGFTTAGGTAANRVARWDGTTWAALGSGMAGGDPPTVRALTVYNGELIAGGNFTTAGGTAANKIAHWDGATWSALGSGMRGTVRAVADYNAELIAGGDFTIAGDYVSAFWARWGCPYSKGDLNCDGAVNAFDIDPFVLAVVNVPEYYRQYPDCDHMHGDIDADGDVDAFDIDPFVELLTGP